MSINHTSDHGTALLCVEGESVDSQHHHLSVVPAVLNQDLPSQLFDAQVMMGQQLDHAGQQQAQVFPVTGIAQHLQR